MKNRSERTRVEDEADERREGEKEAQSGGLIELQRLSSKPASPSSSWCEGRLPRERRGRGVDARAS